MGAVGLLCLVLGCGWGALVSERGLLLGLWVLPRAFLLVWGWYNMVLLLRVLAVECFKVVLVSGCWFLEVSDADF